MKKLYLDKLSTQKEAATIVSIIFGILLTILLAIMFFLSNSTTKHLIENNFLVIVIILSALSFLIIYIFDGLFVIRSKDQMVESEKASKGKYRFHTLYILRLRKDDKEESGYILQSGVNLWKNPFIPHDPKLQFLVLGPSRSSLWYDHEIFDVNSSGHPNSTKLILNFEINLLKHSPTAMSKFNLQNIIPSYLKNLDPTTHEKTSDSRMYIFRTRKYIIEIILKKLRDESDILESLQIDFLKNKNIDFIDQKNQINKILTSVCGDLFEKIHLTKIEIIY